MGERENGFTKDDPLYYLHVPRRERLAEDGGSGSDASLGGSDDGFDRDKVKDRGEVVPAEDLQ